MAGRPGAMYKTNPSYDRIHTLSYSLISGLSSRKYALFHKAQFVNIGVLNAYNARSYPPLHSSVCMRVVSRTAWSAFQHSSLCTGCVRLTRHSIASSRRCDSSIRCTTYSATNLSQPTQIELTHVPAAANEPWLLVVESPAKATSIAGYLAANSGTRGIQVLASYGHVRDLAAKKGAVAVPNSDSNSGSHGNQHEFGMRWDVSNKARERLEAMAMVLKLKEKQGQGQGGVLLLATDPDREGEAIAWHILQSLQAMGSIPPSLTVQRIVFHEVTPQAVLSALSSPRPISLPLVQAYLARRALDHLYGFALSPVLWRKLPGCKSAGRVQSTALAIICAREEQVEAFTAQEHWSVHAALQVVDHAALQGGTQPPLTLDCQLSMLRGRRVVGLAGGSSNNGGGNNKGNDSQLCVLRSSAMADSAVQHVRQQGRGQGGGGGGMLVVSAVRCSERQRNPPAAFTTSSLQQEASAKLGYGVSRTMASAQRLYEGVGSHGGLITYIRTDSAHLAAPACHALRQLAVQRYGVDSVPAGVLKVAGGRGGSKKVKNAQEAHEGIRPTDPSRTPAMLASSLSPDDLRLYRLIWRRALASQMTHAVVQHLALDITDGLTSPTLRLHCTASAVASLGFLAVHKDVEALGTVRGGNEEEVEEEEEEGDKRRLRSLQSIQVGDSLALLDVSATQHFTEPPPRFSEGTLVKKLEEEGVGRPSTYASTIKTLLSREYVVLDSRRLVPTLRGRMVTAFLSHYFTPYVDAAFTSRMEEQLDDITRERAHWAAVLAQFWQPFQERVKLAAALDPQQVGSALRSALGAHLGLVPRQGEQVEEEEEVQGQQEVCSSCGAGVMELRVTSHGSGLFLGCSNYPTCTHKVGIGPKGKRMPAVAQATLLGSDDVTGGQVELRYGPYGPYVELTVPPAVTATASKAGRAKKAKKAAFVSRARVPAHMDPSQVDLPAALALLGPAPTLGQHPVEGGAVEVLHGPYGWYVRHGAVRAALPKGVEHDDVTLTQALQLLEDKREKDAKRPKKMVAEKIAKKTSRKVGGRAPPSMTADMSEPSTNKEGGLAVEKSGRQTRLVPSPELADILGGVDYTTKSEAIKGVWQYIKDKQLQDPNDKRKANLNKTLQNLLGVDSVTCLTISSKLGPHLHKAKS